MAGRFKLGIACARKSTAYAFFRPIARRWCAVTVVLVFLSAGYNVSAYAIEREATVQLLPNDLVEPASTRPDAEKVETNQTITTPQQAIQNQIEKVAQAIRDTLEEARRSIVQRNHGKRDLQSSNSMQYLLPLLMCVAKLGNSGMLPESLVKQLKELKGSSNALAAKKNPPLCSLVKGQQQDPLSNALGGVPTGGVVTDLTGSLHSQHVRGEPPNVALPTPMNGLPGAGTAGVPGMAGGVATGAAVGMAMGTGAAYARNSVPVGGSLLANNPVSGGSIESVPLVATGALASQSPAIQGFNMGYNTGLAMAGLLHNRPA